MEDAVNQEELSAGAAQEDGVDMEAELSESEADSNHAECIRQLSAAGCETRAVTITPMDFGFPSCRGRIFYLHLHKKKLRSMMAEGKMDIPPAFDEFCSNIMDSVVSTIEAFKHTTPTVKLERFLFDNLDPRIQEREPEVGSPNCGKTPRKWVTAYAQIFQDEDLTFDADVVDPAYANNGFYLRLPPRMRVIISYWDQTRPLTEGDEEEDIDLPTWLH